MNFTKFHHISSNFCKFHQISPHSGGNPEKIRPSCGSPKTYIYTRFGRSAAWPVLFHTKILSNPREFHQTSLNFTEIHRNLGGFHQISPNLGGFHRISPGSGGHPERVLPSCGSPKTYIYIYTFWAVRRLAGSFPHQNPLQFRWISRNFIKFHQISPKFRWISPNFTKFHQT